MEESEITQLLAKIARQLATSRAREDALQAVLIATLVALGRSSPNGAKQIEQLALRVSEGIATAQETGESPVPADEFRRHVETILATVGAALTGKTGL